jgi:hypothetical protein
MSQITMTTLKRKKDPAHIKTAHHTGKPRLMGSDSSHRQIKRANLLKMRLNSSISHLKI